MKVIALTAFIAILVLSLAMAFLLILHPALAIELQKKFYSRINWKIEPLSMPKEIRNTRFMGWFLLLASFVAVIFSFRNFLK